MDFFKEWLADLGIDSKVTAMDSSKLGDLILRGEYDAFEWDWFVEPDPDGILADFTCDQRGGLSDSWYCDPAYDAMYKQQNGEMDHAKRVDIVKQMQQTLYQDSPYIVTVYTTHGRGGPERPVRLLPAAARPRRGLAGPVRRAQLLAAPSRRRRGRLRRCRARR